MGSKSALRTKNKKIMIQLPTKSTKGKVQNPKKLLIAGQAKVGKTSLAMQLPNNLLLDLEDGAEGYDGMSVNLRQKAKEVSKSEGIPLLEAMLNVWFETADAIAQSEHKYDFITVDNTTRLEEMADYYATMLYKNSTIGKNFKGTSVVNELPNGGG